MSKQDGKQDGKDSGFTLIELLVVMIIIGILAAIAVPAFVGQKRKAYEAAVKSDVKAIAKEVVGFYIDGTGPLTLTAGATTGSWQLRRGVDPVADGALSKGSVLGNQVIQSDSDYCVAVDPTYNGARTWKATQNGLVPGDC